MSCSGQSRCPKVFRIQPCSTPSDPPTMQNIHSNRWLSHHPLFFSYILEPDPSLLLPPVQLKAIPASSLSPETTALTSFCWTLSECWDGATGLSISVRKYGETPILNHSLPLWNYLFITHPRRCWAGKCQGDDFAMSWRGKHKNKKGLSPCLCKRQQDFFLDGVIQPCIPVGKDQPKASTAHLENCAEQASF